MDILKPTQEVQRLLGLDELNESEFHAMLKLVENDTCSREKLSDYRAVKDGITAESNVVLALGTEKSELIIIALLASVFPSRSNS